MRLKKKSKLIIAGAALVGLAGSGVAYGYWTTSGNGAGSATTGASSAFVVATDGATGGPLTPGGPSETVAFHVTNNNSGVQHLSAVAASVANSDNSAWTAVSGCSLLDYTVVPHFTAGDIASGATASGTVTITMNNLSSSQNGCMNATVPLYVAAS